MDFLERYTSEKLGVLQRECQLIREEVHMNELDTQAPFAYWLFVQQAMQGKEGSEAMVVNILQHALGVQNATVGQRQGVRPVQKYHAGPAWAGLIIRSWHLRYCCKLLQH